MERSLEGHDPVLALSAHGFRPLTRELERSLDGFAPGVAEEDLVQPGAIDQELGELRCRTRAKQVGDVDQAALEPALDRVPNDGASVSEGVHSDAGREVEVGSAILIEELRALPADEDHLRGSVHPEERTRGFSHESDQADAGDSSEPRIQVPEPPVSSPASPMRTSIPWLAASSA